MNVCLHEYKWGGGGHITGCNAVFSSGNVLFQSFLLFLPTAPGLQRHKVDFKGPGVKD